MSQFTHTPSDAHWKTVKCLIPYLKSTANYGLRIAPSTSLNLSVFSNPDWAGKLTDRNSTTGYASFLGLTWVCWSSRKQLPSSTQLAEVLTIQHPKSSFLHHLLVLVLLHRLYFLFHHFRSFCYFISLVYWFIFHHLKLLLKLHISISS